jgi:hypothetical protein
MYDLGRSSYLRRAASAICNKNIKASKDGTGQDRYRKLDLSNDASKHVSDIGVRTRVISASSLPISPSCSLLLVERFFFVDTMVLLLERATHCECSGSHQTMSMQCWRVICQVPV